MVQELSHEERERRAEERRRRIQEWVTNLIQADGIPWTPLAKPFHQCRMALVTTCGLYLPGQEPFDVLDNRQDHSYRELSNAASFKEYGIAHGHYDRKDVELDINVLFPIHHLRELEAQGAIGELAPRHFSFCGYMPDYAPLVSTTAPLVAERLKQDEVDGVLLTPA